MLATQWCNPRLAVPFLLKNGHVLAHGLFKSLIWGKSLAFSFNVSDRCPINCDCYWKAQARTGELSDDEVVSFFKDMRKRGYVHVNLIGGEPYVRPKLLEKIVGIIPFNWLVTSGTTPLRHLKQTTQVISIDGANAETHDAVRKSNGLYNRIVKNMSEAKEKTIGPLFIHTVLNKLNHRQIGDIISTWSENNLAKGVLVSTATPIKGSGDDHLRLSSNERVWIVDELKRLKPLYGDFLLLTDRMIDRLHPDHTISYTPENCWTAKFIESYDAVGKRIPQCILSEKADCTQCGCVVTLMSPKIGENVEGGSTEMARYFLNLTTISK